MFIEMKKVFATSLCYDQSNRISEIFNTNKCNQEHLIRTKKEIRLSPAKIIEPPSNVKVISGETALFFCRVNGNPTPTVNFLLDRQVSRPAPGVGGVLNIPNGSLLRLTKVHRGQNGLQVQCITRNHVGGDSASAYLTVYDTNDRIPDGYPIIHVPPKASSASVGDVARMDCEVSGHPQPTVVWLKNEIPIQTTDKRITFVGTGSILFEHLLLSDEGHYECLVTNQAGSVLSSKAYLRVKNTYFVPKIIDKIDQIGVRYGHNANLTCRAAGNPTTTTRWLTDGERPITDFTEGTSTLYLADITEPARYICEANNSLGTVQHPVRIQIIEVPPPPIDLMCLEKGPTFAFLQWSPAKQSADIQQTTTTTTRTVDSYTVFLYEMENGQTITNKKQLTDIPARQFHLHGALQYKLTDLKPYTMYMVEVSAVSNLLGMSDPSNKVTFITKELPPSSAPYSVETVTITDDSVLVSWKPPKEANGKIIGYNVFYNRNPQAPLDHWQKVGTQFESVKLEKLFTSETYHIRVSAQNSAGDGPLTDPYEVLVKFGIPSQPREFTGLSFNPKEIHLNWISPNLPGKISLQDYLLKYRIAVDMNIDKSKQQQQQQQPMEVKLSADLTEYLMENLIPNSTYHISLAARTKYGTGIAAEIMVQTDSNVPGPPILHELSILDSFSIRIRWLAPHGVLDHINISQYLSRLGNALARTENPSKVLHYLVQWSAFPFTDWEQKKISINYLYPMQQIYEYIIHGLLSRTTYRIRITAVGSEGMGPALELGPIKTKGQVPSAPRNLRLNQLRRATPPGASDPKADYAILELAWDPPERTHGDIRGYQVSHRLIGPIDVLYTSSNRVDTDANSRPPSKPIIRNVTQTAYTSVLSDGIKFGRTYQFEVAAYNGVDLGLPAQLNISTPEDVPGSYSLHVRVKGLSATAIEVTWTPPSRQKWTEEITSYQVKYFQPSAPNETEIITTTQEPLLQIENLKESTFYTVLVRALTKNGPGPWSAASTIRTTAELPEPPSQINGLRINPRQIKVTWNTMPVGPITKPQIPITGFRIFYSTNENTQDLNTWQILDVGPVTMATLDLLDPQKDYVIRIKSRGADRRHGRLSEAIHVGIYNPHEINGANKDINNLANSGPEDLKRISHLSCTWVQTLETAKPGEASLKISWRRPRQLESLYQFEIQLLGSKTYADERSHPHRILYEPRSVEVTTSMLDQSSSSSMNTNGGYMSSTSDYPQYELVIDELEANTVYDVQIKPIYSQHDQSATIDSATPTGRTSCRTQMLPPLLVPRPIPVTVQPETGKVIMRVFRVSESLGRIRRYYLILCKVLTTDSLNLTPKSKEFNWPQKLHDASQSWNPNIFIAAEYSQEAFVGSYVEIILNMPTTEIKKRFKRKTFNKSNGVTNQTHQIQNDKLIHSEKLNTNSLPEILVYGRQLIRNQKYKAFVLACIYPNMPPFGGNTNTISAGSTTSLDSYLYNREQSVEDEESLSKELCTPSLWSIHFQPDQAITYTDKQIGDMHASESIIKENSETSSMKISNTNSKSEFFPKFANSADIFTITLIIIIATLSIIATICTAIGCLMRRRRTKPIDNDMSITLTPSDGMLKTPLMPQSVQNFSGTNGAIEHEPTDPDTPDNPTPVHTPIRSAIPILRLPEYVATLKRDSGVGISEEYESIETPSDLTWKHANMEENRPKNRYANIIAYDQSRVVLNEISRIPGSDYINANFIDGYQKKSAYIATQGPLPGTFYDFWRMVWEQNSRVIVMMTHLEERARIKCDQYWPNRGKEVFTLQQQQQCQQQEYNSKVNYDINYTTVPTYTVIIKSTQEFAYYTLRTFILQRNYETNLLETDSAAFNQHQSINDSNMNIEQREIKQFQFTAWPDYGTPDYPQPLLLFIRRVSQVRSQLMHHLQQERLINDEKVNSRELKLSQSSDIHNSMNLNLSDEIGPLIVHCSAGVGRTGAFIVIDSQLERLKHENSVDIFGAVCRMRAQRNFMVQTEEQYAFLYDVFIEAAEVHGTEVTAHGLYNHVVKLRQPVPTCILAGYNLLPNGLQDNNHLTSSIKISSLELEFKRLNRNLINKRQITTALTYDNKTKNRDFDILPYESNRVCLSLIRGVNGSDYINASYIDGYRKSRAYIATQTPLPHTVDDFWRLIWECNSPIIVAFSDARDMNLIPTDINQYWPSDRSTRYQNLMVEPMVEYNMPHFILREFRLTNTTDGQSRTLRQFQLHGWPHDSIVPKSAEAIIDLIGQVHKTQIQFGQDGPITVHCNTGSGRTGVFICLSILLDRMRSEGMVDMFLITRMLRTQRINTIQTSDQYAFCYAATLEYLASFDHYMS
ncbi:unnamed protein product [Schistosoma intercalatum]|nr:unnamed protein product [Schistosoma intercalatum]CAH8649666.1 unnamed protein product [Schistosoma intercalatum]